MADTSKILFPDGIKTDPNGKYAPIERAKASEVINEGYFIWRDNGLDIIDRYPFGSDEFTLFLRATHTIPEYELADCCPEIYKWVYKARFQWDNFSDGEYRCNFFYNITLRVSVDKKIICNWIELNPNGEHKKIYHWNRVNRENINIENICGATELNGLWHITDAILSINKAIQMRTSTPRIECPEEL